MQTNFEKTATVPALPRNQQLSWIASWISHAGLVVICLFPIPVLGHGVAQVFAGAKHTLVLKKDGTLWGWGDNWDGQLGNGTTEPRSSPVQVGRNNDWASVSVGREHTVALKSDGTLWGWGRIGLASWEMEQRKIEPPRCRWAGRPIGPPFTRGCSAPWP
jgi:alpha-tubulin suppressor-like RCC1 family protein